MKAFEARWGGLLIGTSALATALCFGIAGFAAVQVLEHGGDRRLLWACTLPLVIVVGCALFTIRGYLVAPGAIYVQRLLWATRVSTYGLQSVTFEPNVMRWSIRTFGNGGLFSFCGRYWNRHLGSYHALVTDPRSTVVLRYPHETVVLSPTPPEQFVYELASTHG